MKKLLAACIAFALWAGAGTGAALVRAEPSKPGTSAEAAALIDVKSGRLLYAQQGDKRMRIASLTKIMTAIVAIEQGKLSDQVTVSKNAFGKEGSSIYLKLGEEMSLHHLLYGLMLRSGNDAATAIAEHVGGSEEGFVYLMNEKARELGMEHSHFMNPHGLDHNDHYSTANDMARLTAYALQNPVFQEIVKTEVKKVPNPTESWDHVWSNKNKMLNMYDGADGVKTGYTKIAKRCLVSSATRNGQQLAIVTLNDPNDWLDHRNLLDWGFSHYKLTPLVQKGEALEPGLVAGHSFQYALAEGEASGIARTLQRQDANSAEYRLGLAGTLTLTLNGKTIGSVPVYPEGSPRLAQEMDSRQTFGQGAAVAGGGRGWFANLEQVVRALFAGI
ncbi:D-alanyl-D-alanine carboxypeptidase family protein [Paenibacillus sp. YN15]|uniref:D-alanyl-D-alanine carboxypeptidase family protein n=1 Tax=Paenibacillus sp. YN15 TaxID=1742774 RepID=UPI000DCBEF6C|nr:D-alanyl-D-alanine carboxypeptidase family protein [Paenibacillus sp. YN15]RAV03619.1 D-alanyl-D-alanine carboxypeptidase [Paenibacillus sp. YN15]